MWLNNIENKESFYKRKNSKGEYVDYKRTKQIAKLSCDNCGVLFDRELHELSPKRRNNLYKHFCCECDAKSLGGKMAGVIRSEKTKNSVGKRIKPKGGYYEIYTRKTHPYRPEENWVREHIIIMENFLGRKLEKNEVVHHIDGNKINNDIENLDICTINEHNNCHAKSEQLVFELYKLGKVGYDRKNKRYYLV